MASYYDVYAWSYEVVVPLMMATDWLRVFCPAAAPHTCNYDPNQYNVTLRYVDNICVIYVIKRNLYLKHIPVWCVFSEMQEKIIDVI